MNLTEPWQIRHRRWGQILSNQSLESTDCSSRVIHSDIVDKLEMLGNAISLQLSEVNPTWNDFRERYGCGVLKRTDIRFDRQKRRGKSEASCDQGSCFSTILLYICVYIYIYCYFSGGSIPVGSPSWEPEAWSQKRYSHPREKDKNLGQLFCWSVSMGCFGNPGFGRFLAPWQDSPAQLQLRTALREYNTKPPGKMATWSYASQILGCEAIHPSFIP